MKLINIDLYVLKISKGMVRLVYFHTEQINCIIKRRLSGFASKVFIENCCQVWGLGRIFAVESDKKVQFS